MEGKVEEKVEEKAEGRGERELGGSLNIHNIPDSDTLRESLH